MKCRTWEKYGFLAHTTGISLHIKLRTLTPARLSFFFALDVSSLFWRREILGLREWLHKKRDPVACMELGMNACTRYDMSPQAPRRGKALPRG